SLGELYTLGPKKPFGMAIVFVDNIVTTEEKDVMFPIKPEHAGRRVDVPLDGFHLHGFDAKSDAEKEWFEAGYAMAVQDDGSEREFEIGRDDVSIGGKRRFAGGGYSRVSVRVPDGPFKSGDLILKVRLANFSLGESWPNDALLVVASQAHWGKLTSA